MPIPSDSHVPGDTGHVTDHNSIADTLTALTAAVPAAVAVETARALTAEAVAQPKTTGMVVPAYSYPNPATFWNQLTAAAPTVKYVVANVASGPGSTTDPFYTAAISAAQAAGVVVLGYVDTNFGAVSLSTVQANIGLWQSLYGVTSIFFDRASASTGGLGYVTTACGYVTGKKVLNHGAIPAQGYAAIADILVVFEDVQANWATFLSSAPAWFTAVNPSQLAVMVYAATGTATMAQVMTQAQQLGVGSIYVTDQTGGNPWSAAPSYWAAEVAQALAPLSAYTTAITANTTAITAEATRATTAEALLGPKLTQATVLTANGNASANQVVPVNTTSGNVTVTLPTAPPAGTLVAVKHVIQGGTNTVSVACAGADVFNKAGGSTAGTLTLASQGMLLQYNSGIWMVLADDLPLSQVDARYIITAAAPSGDATGATDTASLQAAINSVGDTSLMRAVRIFLAPGNYIINATLLAQKKSIELIGCGWGTGSTSGYGTTITWAGSAGIPMLRLWACFGSRISRIKFRGLASAKPSAAISIYNLNTDTNGSSFNRIDQCWFGVFEGWDTATANPLTCGVLFEGDNVNDDQSTISGCVFYQCDTGAQYTNTQNIINKIEHCYFYSNGVHVNAGASIALDHTFMSFSATQDLNISNGAVVTCTNFSAEKSAQLAYMRNGCQLLIKTGYWQVTNFLTGSSGATANVIDAVDNTSQAVKLEDYRFTVPSAYTNPATPQLFMGQNASGHGSVQLTLENCSGIVAAPSTAGVYPYMQSGGNTSCHLLLEGSAQGASPTTGQRFRMALDDVSVGFAHAMPINFSTYNVPGVPTAPTAAPLTNSTQLATTAYADAAVAAATATAIGGQAAYAKYSATNPTLALNTSTFGIVTSLPTVTLPNDGHTYRVAFTCPSISLSVTGVVFVGLGSSATVFYAGASINSGATRWGLVNVVAQSVTGSGQTMGIYAKAGAGTPTVTFYAADISSNGAEMAAYRVA